VFLADRGRPDPRALEAWREAAQLVSDRWGAFVDAEAPTRQWAFASYLAALDAEEAAAAQLKARFFRMAA
jgi:hypothetical protein